jgi:hypothetical protein
MIRKTFLTLAVVLFAVVTLIVMPVNAGEVYTQGTEQQSSPYTQEAQAFNQSDAVQYAQISWPFQKNQGEQSQEPQENNQSQSQGEQTQQYAQKQQPQNSNQGTQSQQEQSEQQQQSPNQNDSQSNQVNQENQKAS